MMHGEFNKLLGQPVSPNEYEMVETVYMHHPLITNTHGKEEIVKYYKLGLIRDMYPRAKAIQQVELEAQRQQRHIDKLNEEHRKLIDAEMLTFYALQAELTDLRRPTSTKVTTPKEETK
jgi:hypothetical protein